MLHEGRRFERLGRRREIGPGVTATAIKLGVLTDLTGVFARPASRPSRAGTLFWDARTPTAASATGTVEFVVKDHGYDAQNAVTAYAQIKDDVLALDELLGSPMIAGLLPDLENDQHARRSPRRGRRAC